MKQSKTPYEIRLDLLALAHSIVRDKKQADAIAKFESNGNVYDAASVIKVEPATTDEIVAEATKLNRFVSANKD